MGQDLRRRGTCEWIWLPITAHKSETDHDALVSYVLAAVSVITDGVPMRLDAFRGRPLSHIHVRSMYDDCIYIAKPKAPGNKGKPRPIWKSIRGLPDTIMRMLQLISSSLLPAFVRTYDSIHIFLALIPLSATW